MAETCDAVAIAEFKKSTLRIFHRDALDPQKVAVSWELPFSQK